MQNLELNLLTFPFWWYTKGLGLLWQWNRQQMVMGLHQTGLMLFTKHIREPLYGDYTRSGLILSFFLRIFILIFKLVLLVLRAIALIMVDLLYLVIPPLSLAMIIFQLTKAQ